MSDFPFDDLEDTTDVVAVDGAASRQVRFTFKSGAGYDVPWTTVDYPSVEAAHADLSVPERQKQLAELFEIVAKANAAFIGKNDAVKPAAKPGQPAPAGAQEPPADAPDCPPGWTYKTGVAKATGKPWKGFFPPRGDDTKPIFF